VIRRAWAKTGRAGRLTLYALAAAAVPVALVLLVLGIDVLRAPGELRDDDHRFQTTPRRLAGLWDVGYAPGDATARLLGLGDDVELRELSGLYLKIEPGKIDYQGFPERESLRAKVQFELTRLSREPGDPVRRSRLLTLYGVMNLDGRPLDHREREAMIQKSVSAFRNAIDLDPTNGDAKTNLEAALSIFGPIALPGEQPTGGANQGNTSGQGSTGTGY
jgi:hypothetical protein